MPKNGAFSTKFYQNPQRSEMELNEAIKLKEALENDIGRLLKSFELKTGLRPGVVFHERLEGRDEPYRVNIPVHL